MRSALLLVALALAVAHPASAQDLAHSGDLGGTQPEYTVVQLTDILDRIKTIRSRALVLHEARGLDAVRAKIVADAAGDIIEEINHLTVRYELLEMVDCENCKARAWGYFDRAAAATNLDVLTESVVLSGMKMGAQTRGLSEVADDLLTAIMDLADLLPSPMGAP